MGIYKTTKTLLALVRAIIGKNISTINGRIMIMLMYFVKVSSNYYMYTAKNDPKHEHQLEGTILVSQNNQIDFSSNSI